MSFQARSDHELQQLSDDDAIAYIRAAAAAGALAEARRGLHLLVYGYERNVRRRLSMKLPGAVVEDLTADVLVRACTAAFQGSSVGEFRSWLNAIVQRTIADYYRDLQRRPKQAALPTEHLDDDEVWTREPASFDDTSDVDLRPAIEELLATFNETHRRVIELHVFDGHPAPEVCRRLTGMSEANVAQITSRFRRRARERLQKLLGDPDD